MKTVNDVIRDIDSILEKATESAVKKLVPLTLLERQENQAFSCLELFHMQHYELVYNSFYVRNRSLDTIYASHEGFDGKQSFIPELNQYFMNIGGTLKWSQAEGLSFTQAHEKQFLEWFKNCWKSAGGENSKIPTYFCFEKEYQVQDIMTGEIMGEEECARSLGFDV